MTKKKILVSFILFFAFSMNAQVVINEVMHKPGTSTSTNQGLRKKEYIEIYNKGCSIIDIGCWIIGSGAPLTGTTPYWVGAYQFPSGTSINPGQHLVIGGILSDNNTAYSPTDIDFDINSVNTCQAGSGGWLLPNGDGWVGLFNSNGIVEDAIYWSSSSNPNINTDNDFSVGPCIPTTSCSGITSLMSCREIFQNYPSKLSYGGLSTSFDKTFSRVPDGGSWSRDINPSIAGSNQCNDGQCSSSASFNLSSSIIQPTCSSSNGSITFSPNSGGSYTYTWTPNVSTTNTASNLAAGSYSININSGGCSKDTTIVLSTNNQTVVSNMSASICSGETFTVTPTNGINGSIPNGTTYSWSQPTVPTGVSGGTSGTNETTVFGTLTNSTNSVQTITYNVTPISSSCSGQPFTVTVTLNPKPEINDISIPTCSGIQFVVSPANVTNGIVPNGTTYSWNTPTVTNGITGASGGTNSSTINGILNNTTNVDQTATYTISPISGNCTGQNFIVNVTVNPTPETPTIAVNPPTCTSAGTANISNYTNNVNYFFNPTGPTVNNSGLILDLIAETNYTVNSKNSANCLSLISQFIISKQLDIPPTPVISTTSATCLSEGTAKITNYTSNLNYIFSPTGPIVDALGQITGMILNTDYSVIASNGGCNSLSSSIFRIAPKQPFNAPTFSTDKSTGCTPLNFTLNTPSETGIIYQWFSNGISLGNGASFSGTIVNGGCNDITLTATNALGCSASATQTDLICAEKTPDASFSASPINLFNSSETVNFTNNSIGATSYLWDFGNDFNSTVYDTSVFYQNISGNIPVTLYAYSPSNCVDSSTVILYFNEDAIFYVPNAFTPDQDEVNQTWGPVFTQGFDTYNFDLYVYNRWGELIWESHDADGRWDGTYGSKGTKCMDGVYTWEISFKSKVSDEKINLLGSIRLIR
jgi:gliding motility-associated-like protein